MKIIILGLFQLVHSQLSIWTWIDGSPEFNQEGNYSVRGTPSPIVYPAARQHHAGVLLSESNQFFLFGGESPSNYLNDFWSLSLSSQIWTFIGGNTDPSVIPRGAYGTKGIFSNTNQPGGRVGHSIEIHTGSNLLVLFGGHGFDEKSKLGYLNDLWIYDFIEKEWAWISGTNQIDQQGVYDSTSTFPGGRECFSLTDFGENMILFGGFGYASTSTRGSLNDVWVYMTNQDFWYWLSGSKMVNQVGVYRTKGVHLSSNIIGARYYHSFIKNFNTKSLIVFGGRNGSDLFNDIWSFNINTALWTWLSGGKDVNQPGVYGKLSVSSPNNIPGARYAHKMSSLPGKNSLLLFGGYTTGHLNDLWLFNLTTSQWKWIGGSNMVDQPSVYGTKGIPDADNIPGGRSSPFFNCSETLKKCVLFGGMGFNQNNSGFFNDLWYLDLNSTISIISKSEMYSTVVVTEVDSILSSETIQTQVANSSQYLVTNLSTSFYPTLDYNVDKESSIVVNLKSSTSRRPPLVSGNSKSTVPFWKSIHMIYIILTVGVILITIIIYIYFRPRSPRSETTRSKPSHDLEATNTAYFTYDMTTNSLDTSTITHVPENQGISIPGFLQFTFGQDFRVGKEIARGGMGSICLGDAFHPLLRLYGKTIVVKQMLKQSITEKDVRGFYQEVSLMSFLKEQKHIAKLVGFSSQPFCLLIKYYPLGSLDNWIYSKSAKTLRILIKFMIDISLGVCVLHSKGLVHCDLKPQNILLDQYQSEVFCVLSDFGITQIISAENLLVQAFDVVNVRGASIAYAAPEAILRVRRKQDIHGGLLLKGDIYALGVIIYELMNRIHPLP